MEAAFVAYNQRRLGLAQVSTNLRLLVHMGLFNAFLVGGPANWNLIPISKIMPKESELVVPDLIEKREHIYRATLTTKRCIHDTNQMFLYHHSRNTHA